MSVRVPDLTRLKIRLLLANLSPVWKELEDQERKATPSTEQITEARKQFETRNQAFKYGRANNRSRFVGISTQALSDWLDTEANPSQWEYAVKHLCAAWVLLSGGTGNNPTTQALCNADALVEKISSKEDVRSFARHIGMTYGDMHQVLDETWHQRAPFVERGYFETEKRARQYLKEMQGVYQVWLERVRKDEYFWFQAALHVRHVLTLKGKGAGSVIRVKLVGPDLENPERRWQYDGSLVILDKRAHWVLGRRGDVEPDFLFMTTTGSGVDYASKEPNKPWVLRGSYLSCDQVNRNPDTIGRVVMRRLFKNDEAILGEVLKNSLEEQNPDATQDRDELCRLTMHKLPRQLGKDDKGLKLLLATAEATNTTVFADRPVPWGTASQGAAGSGS